jgi:DNA-binding MarR family transcriptional regulator
MEHVHDTPPARGSHRQEPLATRLRSTLLRTSRRLREERPGELTQPQLTALSQVFTHGPLTAGELADREHVRPPSMTRTVTALVDAGLLVRSRPDDDRRQVRLAVSDRGREMVLTTRRRRDEWLRRRLSTLTPAERAVLSDAEEILRKVLAV